MPMYLGPLPRVVQDFVGVGGGDWRASWPEPRRPWSRCLTLWETGFVGVAVDALARCDANCDAT